MSEDLCGQVKPQDGRLKAPSPPENGSPQEEFLTFPIEGDSEIIAFCLIAFLLYPFIFRIGRHATLME